jgi:arabinose-5-phosphate isomerase
MTVKDQSHRILTTAAEVLSVEASAILAARDRLGSEFTSALRAMIPRSDGGRIVVMGMGKSGHIGRKIAATLASTGSTALFVHPAEAGHGDLGMVTNHDVVLAISQSGESDELLRLLPYFKRHRISLVAMTANRSSNLARHADVCIDTSVDREACPLGLAPTASTTLALALGDALAMCLLHESGFTAEMFAITHPHGRLGRRLLVSVDDVMVSGSEMPVSRHDTIIRDALMIISRAGLGFTSVVDERNRLIGVFTDGDLRRALDRGVNINVENLTAVMARDFKSIMPAQLAVEAVELMQEHKILGLPVVDEHGYVVGALNMRILLLAGVV